MFSEVCSQTSFFPLFGESPRRVPGERREAGRKRQREKPVLGVGIYLRGERSHLSREKAYAWREVSSFSPRSGLLFVSRHSPRTFSKKRKKWGLRADLRKQGSFSRGREAFLSPKGIATKEAGFPSSLSGETFLLFLRSFSRSFLLPSLVGPPSSFPTLSTDFVQKAGKMGFESRPQKTREF